MQKNDFSNQISFCTLIGIKHANFFSKELEMFSNIGDSNIIIKAVKTLDHDK